MYHSSTERVRKFRARQKLKRQQESQPKSKRGGPRPGAGRPKGTIRSTKTSADRCRTYRHRIKERLNQNNQRNLRKVELRPQFEDQASASWSVSGNSPIYLKTDPEDIYYNEDMPPSAESQGSETDNESDVCSEASHPANLTSLVNSDDVKDNIFVKKEPELLIDNNDPAGSSNVSGTPPVYIKKEPDDIYYNEDTPPLGSSDLLLESQDSEEDDNYDVLLPILIKSKYYPSEDCPVYGSVEDSPPRSRKYPSRKRKRIEPPFHRFERVQANAEIRHRERQDAHNNITQMIAQCRQAILQLDDDSI